MFWDKFVVLANTLTYRIPTLIISEKIPIEQKCRTYFWIIAENRSQPLYPSTQLKTIELRAKPIENSLLCNRVVTAYLKGSTALISTGGTVTSFDKGKSLEIASNIFV